jgi:hypothetical protein
MTLRTPTLISTFLAAMATTGGCATSVEAAPATTRLVAVGDLHGDVENARAVLRMAGIVDAEGRWVGGSTTLVQTGDTTDRGPDSKAILELLRDLQPKAREVGGEVIALLGNHEVMNLQGDWRYVHPGDIQAFGGEEARRASLSPSGPLGSWLRTLPAVAKVDGVVFAHGGVTPEWAAKGVDGLNGLVRDAIDQPDAPVLGPDGPLWSRDLVSLSEEEACPKLRRALDLLAANRMVVGHTTRRDGRVLSRCGGALHVIDVGIASGYGGNLGAWQSQGGDAVALYPSGPADLEDPT